MLDKLHKCSWFIKITNAIQARIVGNIARGLTQAQKIKKKKKRGRTTVPLLLMSKSSFEFLSETIPRREVEV